MKSIINFIKSAALVCLLAPAIILAQTNGGEGVVLANINIGEAFVTQAGDQVKVTFVVDNLGDQPQSDLHFGLEIIKVAEDGSQELVDTSVSPEAVTVMPGVSQFEELTYSSAGLASGSYQVWVLAMTPGGLVVGIALAGDVSSALADALEIKSESCRLFASDSSEEYLLSAGVDVASEEDLVLKCSVVNHGSISRLISPEFVTYERSVFGEVVAMTYPVVAPVEILAGEEKAIELILPKALRPQAYDLVVTYKSETDGAVSNKAIAHYVLQGQSATVQSVQFSKDAYKAGEEIELSILWSESADTFSESRGGGTEKTEDYFVEVAVTDQSGYVCGSTDMKTSADLLTMKITTTMSCTNPTALVTLKTASGQILDSESVTVVPSSNIVVEETIENTEVRPSSIIYIVIGLLAGIGILLLVWYARKKHNHIVADAAMSLVFVLVFGAGLLTSARTAEAVTWSYSEVRQDCSIAGGDGGVCEDYNYTYATAVINTNRTTYSPGEAIVLSGTVRNHACSNVNYGLRASLVGSQTSLLSATFAGTRNVSSNLTAPTTPGNYTISLNLCIGNQRSCSSASINIRVVATAVAGRCSTSHYRCAAGTSVSGSNNATNYTWRCNGQNGGASASCTETKINASCGAVRNTCVAGVATGGGQTAANYTWSCNSVNGGTNASCSVPIPPTITLSASPALIGPGTSSNISWTTTNATSCTAGGGWSGVKAIVGGTESVSPGATSAYTLNCTGPGGATSAATTVTLPTGTLTATACSIPINGISCLSTVNWSRTNFLGAVSVLQSGLDFSSAASGPVTRTVTPDDRTFRLDDHGSNFEVTAVANITCVNGGVWVSSLSRCVDAPRITISTYPELVRSGGTAQVNVRVESAYDLTCTLAGGINETITHLGTVESAQNYTETTNALTAAQIVNISCVADIASDLRNSAETRISVVPEIQEI